MDNDKEIDKYEKREMAPHFSAWNFMWLFLGPIGIIVLIVKYNGFSKKKSIYEYDRDHNVQKHIVIDDNRTDENKGNNNINVKF